MKAINTIIFDLGNVILPIDYQKCINALQQYSDKELNIQLFEQWAPSLFDKQEVGAISDERFAEILIENAGLRCSQQEVFDAWNQLLLEVPSNRFALLEQLAGEYDLYLLSNTNSIHQQHFEMRIQEQNNGKPLSHFFKKTYYSHVIKQRKPHFACYRFVINDSHIEPAHTLFIDDNRANVLGAAALQINVLHLKVFDNLHQLLEKILNRPLF